MRAVWTVTPDEGGRKRVALVPAGMDLSDLQISGTMTGSTADWVALYTESNVLLSGGTSKAVWNY